MALRHKTLDEMPFCVQPQGQRHVVAVEKTEVCVDGKRRLLRRERLHVLFDLLGVANRQAVDVGADLTHLRLGVLHEVYEHYAPANIE